MRRGLVAWLMAVLCAASVMAAPPQYLDQNWKQTDREWFYSRPQGSKMMPYSWALALEMPNSEALFFSDDLARFGYLSNGKNKANHDGLPVGFVRDTANAGDSLGMTCAACHTGRIDYKGVSYQIDGAPTDADLLNLLAEFDESLLVTRGENASNPKFARFAKRVLGHGNTAKARAALYKRLVTFSKYFDEFVVATIPASPWGRARADAFGAIFNRVTAIDLHYPKNNRPPDAPVSYPFLWDTSWHDKVQWNGSAPNEFAVLRLARNVGEVLGVFANITIPNGAGLPWYDSTAKRVNLLEIEDRLAELRSPRWPAAFPPLDQARVAAGKAIYDAQCLSCHIIETPGKHQDITMTPISDPMLGTDPMMAKLSNGQMQWAQRSTGPLKGMKEFFIAGDPFGDTASAGSLTFHSVLGAIVSPIPSDWYKGTPTTAATQTAHKSTATRTGPGSESELRQHLLSDAHKLVSHVESGAAAMMKAAQSDPVMHDLGAALQSLQKTPPSDPMSYKGRPLDGIWATSPYLHNGSVPTLNDLLLPEAQRPKTFFVGSREFDPVNVGVETNEAAGSFRYDTSLEGNSNAGHTWGVTLTPEQRMALIEYLKSL
jgi:hypothetical protein